MFFRISTVFVVALAAFAAASPAPWGAPPPTTTTHPPVTTTVTVTAPATTTTIPASQCNTGDAQCCNSVQSATAPAVTSLLGLLGIVLEDINVLVGLSCDPISVIGVGGGANCVQQPVCCENNNFNGLINIGCTPINIFL
uniref:Class I hydrophobin 1 n=1 Tax=Heterobasidion annosum TaxID=13563 RepID=HAH1_HETAN|nr:hydrophobin 1 [Heterobasidion annosum]